MMELVQRRCYGVLTGIISGVLPGALGIEQGRSHWQSCSYLCATAAISTGILQDRASFSLFFFLHLSVSEANL
ncbi:MAG: hypothetical protein DCF17_01795 [Shackletoniella antarctica]|uniref:Uncharacterized protein n=1 Tax=Shackletoniella antarctica TaxID=268115 RepID=A0A2W4WJR4_9CYAN|nr:MAG: hypothetical protein DCF17_01795 [Shackletoniella antarctica]